MITLDALHMTIKIAQTIAESHGAVFVFTVKGNSPLAYEHLSSLDWERDSVGCLPRRRTRITDAWSSVKQKL